MPTYVTRTLPQFTAILSDIIEVIADEHANLSLKNLLTFLEIAKDPNKTVAHYTMVTGQAYSSLERRIQVLCGNPKYAPKDLQEDPLIGRKGSPPETTYSLSPHGDALIAKCYRKLLRAV